MNMWEDGSKIFVDVMQYANAPLFPNADGSPGKPAGARLVRWTIDLADNTNIIKQEKLDDLAGEFPRFDERRAGLSYRHGYFAASSTNSNKILFDSIAHIDVGTGKRTMHTFADGMPGEPLFVPRSADAAEGDGWLVGDGLSPLRGPQRFRGVRGDGCGQGPHRLGRAAAARALRLPRQLARGVERVAILRSSFTSPQGGGESCQPNSPHPELVEGRGPHHMR